MTILEAMPQKQIETILALRAVKDAHLEHIPLVAEVDQMRWTSPTIKFMHYDFGDNLSLSEIRVIQQIVRVAARKLDCEAAFTLETLRFSVIPPDPKKTKQALEQAKAEAQADVHRYKRLCQPFAPSTSPFRGANGASPLTSVAELTPQPKNRTPKS